MSWTNELAREISGRVLTDDAAREAVATDFGRIVVRRPQVVVCPASAEDVARVVKFAARNSLHVATRGGGHSQSGQSLSDQIVLDMTSLDQVTACSRRCRHRAGGNQVAGAGGAPRAAAPLASGLDQ